MIKTNSMLLALPVPFKSDGAHLQIEQQAANGIRQWSRYFDSLTICAPIFFDRNLQSAVYLDSSKIDLPDHVHLVPLPVGYHPLQHIKNVRHVQNTLRGLISQARFLQFAVGGCTFGDWPAVAARLAMCAGRAYAVHTDWVTHLVCKKQVSKGFKSRIKNAVDWRLMRRAERPIISLANLGLFHGADCFDFYKKWQFNAHLVHDIHVSVKNLISAESVQKKSRRIDRLEPLRLVYIGRMHSMKGPSQWLTTLAELKSLGVAFNATWMGEGDERLAMENAIDRLGLKSFVDLRPFQPQQSAVIELLRNSDLFVFCHLTAESPRNLIESLNQATPIVGFESAYSLDLTKDGGGLLVPMADCSALAQAIKRLSDSRQELRELIVGAQDVGSHFTDEAVFEHRANLIKLMPFNA